MKKAIIFLFLFSCVTFSQVQYETVTFSDTTTSAVIDVPRSMYLAGIAKPDSGGLTLLFDAFLTSADTMAYSILTLDADSVYTVVLPDSTSEYAIPLPSELFDMWRYFKVRFDKTTTCGITLVWKHK